MCTVKDVHKKDRHTLESSCKVLESGAKEKKTWPESVCEGLSDEGYSDCGSDW